MLLIFVDMLGRYDSSQPKYACYLPTSPMKSKDKRQKKDKRQTVGNN